MGSYYKQQLNDFVANQEVKADILFDIGGAQNPIKGRTKSWAVDNYKVVDLAEPHVTLQKPDIFQDMNKILENGIVDYMSQVDLIFMLGVMDYVINPNVAMENINLLLKPGGEAWIEWPFVYPHHNPIDDEGCRYSHGCIKRLCHQAELYIEEWVWKRPKPGNPYLMLFYQEDGMRMARNFDHNVTGFITRVRK